MKPNAVVAATILAIIVSPAVAAPSSKVLKGVMKVLAGAAAAASLEKSGQAFVQYQQADETLKSLRAQGVTESQPAVYSVYFTLNGDASSVYWSDWLSKPDVFFALDIEGEGTCIVPQIRPNYSGGPILDRILANEVPPGSRIVVRVMDDDTSSDEIWNNIVKSRVNYTISAGVEAARIVKASAQVDGHLQLLTDGQHVTIDAPDYIASVEFTVPNSTNGRWVVEGELVDSTSRPVGTIQVAKLWSPQQEAMTPATVQAQQSFSFGKMIFWGVIGVLVLGWLAAGVFKTRSEIDPGEPSK